MFVAIAEPKPPHPVCRQKPQAPFDRSSRYTPTEPPGTPPAPGEDTGAVLEIINGGIWPASVFRKFATESGTGRGRCSGGEKSEVRSQRSEVRSDKTDGRRVGPSARALSDL